LALLEKTVGHIDRLLHQAAAVVAQIEYQSFDLAFSEMRQGLVHLMAGGFVESFDLYVRYPGLIQNAWFTLPRERCLVLLKVQWLFSA